MTVVETMKILAVLKAAYPAAFGKMSDEEIDAVINLWAEMFAADPYELVGMAVKSFIATDTEGFPPAVGKIKAEISKLQQPNRMTEQEAVNMIMAAARNGIYGAAEEFKKLPKELQQLVGSPAQLRDWGVMDTDTINSVVASNLRASYKVLAKRKEEQAALPAVVKEYMRLAATGPALIE